MKFYVAMVVFLLVLGAIGIPVEAQSPRPSPVGPTPRTFTADRSTIPVRNRTEQVDYCRLELGPEMLVSGAGPNRTIHTVSLAFKRGPLLIGSDAARREAPDTLKRHWSALEVRQVEIRERDRTVALLDTPALLTGPTARAEWPVSIPVSTWPEITILYHVRVTSSDTAGSALLPLSHGGQRTIVWPVKSYDFSLSAPRTPGRPPTPGRLRTVGTGITIHPFRPLVGETFTASISFINAGERPTSPAALHWRYGTLTQEVRVPELAAGAVHTVAFEAIADEEHDRIRLEGGEREFIHDITVIRRADPRLVSIACEENYSDEPLILLALVENTGTGAAERLNLRLSTSDAETTFTVPTIPVRGRAPVRFSWPGLLPESFALTATLMIDEQEAAPLTIGVRRAARPRSSFTIDRISFSPDRTVGGPARLMLSIRNTGNLDGQASARLAVTANGSTLAERDWSGRIGAGETRECTTEPFALPAGLIRGHAAVGEAEDQVLVDVAPPSFEFPEDVIVLAPATSASFPFKIEERSRFSFAPIADLDEIDSVATLVVPVTAWPGGRRESRSAARIFLTAGDWQERFDIAATETFFSCPLSAEILVETLTIRFDPANGQVLYAPDAPRLLVRAAAAENGRIIQSVLEGNAVAVTIVNEARLIPSHLVTIALETDDGNETRVIVEAEPGEPRKILLPLPPQPPGRRSVRITLPNSARRGESRIQRLVIPSPPPSVRLTSVSVARLDGSGETFLVSAVSSVGNAAYDVTVTTREPQRSRLSFAPFASEIACLPEGETGIVTLAPATAAEITYGEQYSGLAAPLGAPRFPGRRLRLIDLGDDTPALGQDVVIRFLRSAEAGALDEGRVFISVNGLLRGAVPVPAQETGVIHFGSFRLRPGGSGAIAALLFEATTNGEVWPAARHLVAAAGVFEATEQTITTRADRDWILPVTVPSEPTRAIPALERLSDLAWDAARHLAGQGLAPMPTITPQSARDLGRLSSETSPMGRIAFRETLNRFVGEWQATALLLEGSRLPVTLDVSHFEAFRKALEELDEAAKSPTPVDRQQLDRKLARFAAAVEFVLGTAVDPKLLNR